MFSLQGLFVGTAMIIFGVLGLKFTYAILNMTGSQGWLERYTGGGSTYGMYKIFSVFLVIIGILVATGFGNNVMGFLFAPLVNIFKNSGVGA